jgi:hypothetical protein
MQAFGKAHRIEFSAIVTRADGSIEDCGIIGYYHSNPVLRIMWTIKQNIKGCRKWLKQQF